MENILGFHVALTFRNKQEVDRGYLLECGGPRIPGQGTMSLKHKLSLMSSPAPTLLSPGLPRVGRCQSLLEHGRIADLGGGDPQKATGCLERPGSGGHTATSPTAASLTRNAGAPGGRAYRSLRASGAARFLSAVHPDGL